MEPTERVEVLVDDDEGHSDGDDGDPRGIAKQCMERLRRAEKRRIDGSAAEIDQRQQGKQSHFPAADELGWKATNESFSGHSLIKGSEGQNAREDTSPPAPGSVSL